MIRRHVESEGELLHQLYNFIFLGLFLTTLLPSIAAASPAGSIRQIFLDRNRVVAELEKTETTTPVDEFVVTFKDGRQCALKAIEKKDSLLSLDVANCDKKSELIVGMAIEPSLLFGTNNPPAESVLPSPTPVPAPIEAKKPEPSQERNRERPQFAIGAGVSSGSKARFTNGSVSGVAGSFTTDLDIESGVSLTADARRLKKHEWGVQAGVTYDFPRPISSFSVSSGGVTLTVRDGTAKISSTFVEANAVYLWDQFYIPLGLNYSSFRFEPASSYTGGFEIRGGFGAQLGLGLHLNDQVVLELWSRATTCKFKTIYNGTTTDYGDGVYTSVLLAIKGVF